MHRERDSKISLDQIRPKKREPVAQQYLDDNTIASLVVSPRVLVELLSLLGIFPILALLQTNKILIAAQESWKTLAIAMKLIQFQGDVPEIGPNNFRDLVLYSVCKISVLCAHCRLKPWEGYFNMWWTPYFQHSSVFGKQLCYDCFTKCQPMNVLPIEDDHPMAEDKYINARGYWQRLKPEYEGLIESEKFDNTHNMDRDTCGPLGQTIQPTHMDIDGYSVAYTRYAVISKMTITKSHAMDKFRLGTRDVAPLLDLDDGSNIIYNDARNATLKKYGNFFNLSIAFRKKAMEKINRSLKAKDKNAIDLDVVIADLGLGPDTLNWSFVKDFLAKKKCKADISSTNIGGFIREFSSTVSYSFCFSQKNKNLLTIKKIKPLLQAIVFFRSVGAVCNTDSPSYWMNFDMAWALRTVDEILYMNPELNTITSDPNPSSSSSSTSSPSFVAANISSTSSTGNTSSTANTSNTGNTSSSSAITVRTRSTLLEIGYAPESYITEISPEAQARIPDFLKEHFDIILSLSALQKLCAIRSKGVSADQQILFSRDAKNFVLELFDPNPYDY